MKKLFKTKKTDLEGTHKGKEEVEEKDAKVQSEVLDKKHIEVLDNSCNLEEVNKNVIRLEKILQIKEENELDKSHHSHYINFYKLTRRYMTIFQSTSDQLPKEMKAIYSENIPIVSELTFEKFLVDPPSDNVQVLLFKGKCKKEYVLKRFAYPPKAEEKSPTELANLEKFIQEKFLEYSLMKLYEACPHSSCPLFFNIVQIKMKNIIVTELLMEYAGIPSEKYVFKTIENLYDFFKQSAIALKVLEAYKLEHNDIKVQNIMVDTIQDVFLVKVIDFDIGMNQSVTCKTDSTMGVRGISHLYAAPEYIVHLADPASNAKFERVNPWKGQIYSMGIVMLVLMQIVPQKINSVFIQMIKTSMPGNYIELINKLKGIANESNDSLQKNIIYLTMLCLSYEPKERPSAFELDILLQNLPTKNEESIKIEYEKLIQGRPKTKSQLNSEIEELNGQISKIKEEHLIKINELNHEKKALFDNMNELHSKLELTTKSKEESDKQLIENKKKIETLESENKDLKIINEYNSKKIFNLENLVEGTQKFVTKLPIPSPPISSEIKKGVVEEDKLASALKINEELTKEISTLKSESTQKNDKLFKLEKELSELKQDILKRETLELENTKTLKSLKLQSSNLVKENETIKKEKEALSKNLEELVNNNNQLISKIKIEKEKIEEEQAREKEEYRKVHDQDISLIIELQQETEKYKNKSLESEQKANANSITLEVTQKKSQEMQQLIEELVKLKSENEKDIVDQNFELMNYQTILSKIEEEIENILSHCDENKNTKDELKKGKDNKKEPKEKETKLNDKSEKKEISKESDKNELLLKDSSSKEIRENQKYIPKDLQYYIHLMKQLSEKFKEIEMSFDKLLKETA